MKIRIKGNSLRYRLTRTDVERFAQDGYLEECTDFGPTRLTYSLQQTAAGQLWAYFENNNITLYMPQWMTTEWATTERVGFESKESDLYLLIEKDFKCLDNVAEDQSDNYPNPLMMKM
jgi:3-methyladenine DNA glycosylase Mpg